MFPQHTEEFLREAVLDNITLQDAIDFVLDNQALPQDTNTFTCAKQFRTESIPSTQPSSISEILKNLSSKILQGGYVKINVGPNDIKADAISYYKNQKFDATKKIRVSFCNQPGIDTGGPSRQFFTDATAAISSCPTYKLFEGESNRMQPSYNSTSVHSGLFEVLGKIIGHGILQSAVGFPYFAPYVYWYIATGDVQKSLCYVTLQDVRDERVKENIEKVASADENTIFALKKDDEDFLSLCNECGIRKKQAFGCTVPADVSDHQSEEGFARPNSIRASKCESFIVY